MSTINRPNSFSLQSLKAVRFVVLVFICQAAFQGCKRNDESNSPADGTATQVESTAQVPEKQDTTDSSNGGLFAELTASQTGVDFKHELLPDHPLAYLYHSGYSCGGVGIGDVNGDELADIFLVSGPGKNALYINKGNLTFERSDAIRDVRDDWAVGPGIIDVDNDNDLDIFVCNYNSPNQLWINEGTDADGNPKFRECAKEAGVEYIGPSQCPYFSDFDQDGDLDLFLLTNRLYSPTGRPTGVASELGPDRKPRVKDQFAQYFRVVDPAVEVPSEIIGQRTPGPFMLEYGHEDRLYRNDGETNGVVRFTDVTKQSGIESIPGHGLSALIWDINDDGRPDIYVANDYTDPDRLWINQGPDEKGNLKFVEKTDDYVPYTAWSAMGSDVADVNGDGRLDFMIADMAGTTHFKAKSTMGEMTGWRRWVLENGWPRQSMRNMLYVNTGLGRFQEAAYMAGIGSSDWTWSVKFADFDLDGRNDVFLTNGSARVFTDSDVFVRPEMIVGRTEWSIFRDKPAMREENIVFRNNGELEFENVSEEWNLNKKSMSYGAAYGDLDNDGDLDLVVCNLDDPVSIYKNNAADRDGHWLRVKLAGPSHNRFGVGATVTLTLSDGRKLVRLMNPQTGYLSVNDPVVHFGLGNAQISELQVKWQDGTTSAVGPVAADQMVVVSATDDNGESIESKPSSESMFEQIANDVGLKFKHRERRFNDYKREFLLPGKLSQFGPGIAVADINGDDRDDIFVGGASGQSGVLFVHQPDHTFRAASAMPWTEDAYSEDMGVLFFDADGDGDSDLYVAHGSNEWEPDDKTYADALYLNESTSDQVAFKKCEPQSLPQRYDSSSCVVGADFDRDGDIDLFVGSRSVPGNYPMTPESVLLRNESTNGDVEFNDATETVCSSLRNCGLVTGALWSDVNGDGWIDLLVTTEWGPLRVFVNQAGKSLDEQTNLAGLAEHTGWWNSITGADVDGDGDTDYVTLNVGFNTKYGHASAKKPAILYRGDMDTNGVVDLVEAKLTSDSGELPVRGRSCSCNAMPLLRKKFPTYKQFASSTLEGIYTDTTLETADRVTATEFASGVWINNSDSENISFTWTPLPTAAQISPGFGGVAADFLGEQRPTLAISQNHFTREPETGLWRGGLGVMLTPSEGSFKPIEFAQSGFMIDGDGKGLALTDLNADGRPDIVAAQNNDDLLAFRNSHKGVNPLVVSLRGKNGNPAAFGAKVFLLKDDQIVSSCEVYGGSGYLSQSTANVYFTRGHDADHAYSVKVRWPNGHEQTVPAPADDMTLTITEQE